MTMKAILTRDGQRVILAKGEWRQTISVDQLPGQLKLYRDLRDRKAPRDAKGRITEPGPFHDTYAPNVLALEAVERKLKEIRA